MASPVMFQDCGKATPYAYAAIVQRKVVGGGLANTDGSSSLMSYLRIDFKDVVITQLSWNSQDDGIKETFQIVCAQAAVQYRQQQHSGKVNAPTPPGMWQK
jgi:type VI protein secretion system component Hcp